MWKILIFCALLAGSLTATHVSSRQINYAKTPGTINSDGVLDLFSSATRTVPVENSYLFDGKVFLTGLDTTALGNGAALQLVVLTPDTPTHVNIFHMDVFSIASRIEFDIVEAVVCSSCTTGWALIAPVNRKRCDSVYASKTIVYRKPVGIAGGTRLDRIHTGSGGIGGNASAEVCLEEIGLMLKPNTRYLFRVKNNDGTTNEISIRIYWYEEAR